MSFHKCKPEIIILDQPCICPPPCRKPPCPPPCICPPDTQKPLVSFSAIFSIAPEPFNIFAIDPQSSVKLSEQANITTQYFVAPDPPYHNSAGNNLDPFTGVFTVPVAGLYQINARVYLQLLSTDEIPGPDTEPIQLRLIRNNTPLGVVNEIVQSYGATVGSATIPINPPVDVNFVPAQEFVINTNAKLEKDDEISLEVFNPYTFSIKMTSPVTRAEGHPLNTFSGFKYANKP